MRLVAALCLLPLTAATFPIVELADVAELSHKRDARLKPNATIAVTGEFAGLLQRDGAPVVTLFDKAASTAAGCAFTGKPPLDLAALQPAHRYTVQGAVATWQPADKGGALLLNNCQLLPELIELKKNTLYLGVISTDGREVGFQLMLLDGGEGPVRATLTAIDPGHFLEHWEKRHELSPTLLLSPKPTDWIGSYSRANGKFRFTRKDQQLELTLQSPASFAGKLVARKDLETDARMIVANSSGSLIDYKVTPASTSNRPPVERPREQSKPPRINQTGSYEEAKFVTYEWLGERCFGSKFSDRYVERQIRKPREVFCDYSSTPLSAKKLISGEWELEFMIRQRSSEKAKPERHLLVRIGSVRIGSDRIGSDRITSDKDSVLEVNTYSIQTISFDGARDASPWLNAAPLPTISTRKKAENDPDDMAGNAADKFLWRKHSTGGQSQTMEQFREMNLKGEILLRERLLAREKKENPSRWEFQYEIHKYIGLRQAASRENGTPLRLTVVLREIDGKPVVENVWLDPALKPASPVASHN